MTTAFVLGNGVSRQGISLPELQKHGKIYGCNALYREFTPDVLIATDTPIATHIQDLGYAKTNKFYTRKPIQGTGALRLPKEYYGYSSGPNAAGVAANDRHNIIYLLGFDMGPKENNQFNNLYADTEFYRTSAHPPTFAGNWIKQLAQVIKDHPRTQFFRISGPTTAKIIELDALNNLKHLDLTSFLNQLNKQKDL